MTKNILITGGSGYLGRHLISSLVRQDFECTSVDLRIDPQIEKNVRYLQADVASPESVEQIAKLGPFDAICHLASQIDFAVESQRSLFVNNVMATTAVCQIAKLTNCPKVVFTSSNSVYLGNLEKRQISELDQPIPIDDYGQSKLLSERILCQNSSTFDSISIRCPNIMDAGRVGMLSLLFEFIREGKKCWVLGKGDARYQAIYAQDVISAIISSFDFEGSRVFNIGSDNVPTISEMYQDVIKFAQSGAKIAHIPERPAIFALSLAHTLGMSPLGPYQFRMLTSDCILDTSKIKGELGWRPTLTNGEMLTKAYEFYISHRDEILADDGLSANQGAVQLGLLKFLKWIS
jgi:UDP-glucose 4-epimerase